MRYINLTDDPERRKIYHKNPEDWKVRKFSCKAESKVWLSQMSKGNGNICIIENLGWRFGYMFTITKNTKE